MPIREAAMITREFVVIHCYNGQPTTCPICGARTTPRGTDNEYPEATREDCLAGCGTFFFCEEV
jgi:hypothetical protein